jgi:hypothetical protein
MTASSAELLLAAQLEQANIPFEREYRFAPPRRWRFDFAWRNDHDGWRAFGLRVEQGIAVEIEGGSFTGGHKHGLAYESDCDKNNEAMLRGWQVFRFTPAMVDDGRALAVIQQALGVEAAA